MAGCASSLFGNTSQFIKINGGDFVAIQGSETRERLITSDLRIPYKQILKSRVILKVGQENYLLNHLGMGDNATFLAIKATYNPLSVNETDNYITYSYYDDMLKQYYFDQLLVLTGNSSHRIQQLYLTNPSEKYDVFLDVMIAVIDDQYSFFNDVVNQTGTTFFGLEYTDIKTHIVGETIVFFDKNTPPLPLVYLDLSDINSLEVSGKILTIDDSSLGTILFQFLTENDANQANSLINYVLENPTANIDLLSPVGDSVDPIIYFYDRVGATSSGQYITFNGSTASVPYNTSFGFTFSTSISLTTFGSASIIDKTKLSTLLIDEVIDNRDGVVSIPVEYINLYSTSGSVDSITTTGSYSVTFDYYDIARNQLDGIIININITT